MVKQTKEFLSQIEKLVQFAQKNGATQSQIYMLNSDDFSVDKRRAFTSANGAILIAQIPLRL